MVFVGGFSYADVNDSAKGWAGEILFHPLLLRQFEAFRRRSDTFSLGVCNGCQLMALLGWVPFPAVTSGDATKKEEEEEKEGAEAGGLSTNPQHVQQTTSHHPPEARFVRNLSGRFESRWSAVQVQPSPAVLLRGMAGSTLGG